MKKKGGTSFFLQPENLEEFFRDSFFPRLPNPTEENERVLRETAISEAHPGKVLKDFQVLLDSLQPRGVEVSKKQLFFPAKYREELNAKLSFSTQPNLKRPVQQSYPYIHGLYFLLRSSGLARVDFQQSKPRLTIAEEYLQVWRELNPTEQYFALLEAWLLWGNEEIVSSGRSPFSCLAHCNQFWAKLSRNELNWKNNEELNRSFSVWPGLHNLALLHLFGWLDIEFNQPKSGKIWKVKKIHISPWGDALARLLFASYMGESEEAYDEEIDEEEAKKPYWSASREKKMRRSPGFQIAYDAFQPALQPFQPEYRKIFTPISDRFVAGTHILKVSLEKAWRRLAVSTDQNLEDLSYKILNVFDFDCDHLYLFRFLLRTGQTVEFRSPEFLDTMSYYERGYFADDILLGDLPWEVGEAMTFVFDMGDNWQFDVLFEGVWPASEPEPDREEIEAFGKPPEQYPGEEDFFLLP